MAEFDQKAFDEFIVDNGIVGFKEDPFILKSGRESHWYVNWRTISGKYDGLVAITKFLLEFTESRGLLPDCFYGVPQGATALGVHATTQQIAKRYAQGPVPAGLVVPVGREKPKSHGDPENRYFVRAPKGNVIIVEDVTTTGGSLITQIERVRELDGVRILRAIGLTNRMEYGPGRKTVEELVNALGVEYDNMSNAIDLLPLAYTKDRVSREIGDKVEAEFERIGILPLKLSDE